MNEAPLGEAGHDVDSSHVRKRDTSAPPNAGIPRKAQHDRGVSLADSGTLIHPDTRRGV